MYVKVRTFDGTKTAILDISKTASVKQFKHKVYEEFDVAPERQRLFFGGKQMEDGYMMFDYDVNVNDVIQLFVKSVLTDVSNESPKSVTKEKSKSERTNSDVEDKKNSTLCKSKYYEVGDLVDAKNLEDGSWWEAAIVKITLNSVFPKKKSSLVDDGLIYSVKFESYENDPEVDVKLENVRPRARTILPLKKIKNGNTVMVNYNFESPEDRGYWYDCLITRIINTRSKKTVIGTIFAGNNSPVEECHISLIEEIFEIEKTTPLADKKEASSEEIPKNRQSGPACVSCKDNPKKNCKNCGCYQCDGKENPDQQLMCDECNQAFHIYCLDPPLEEIPDVEEWFCPLCKNDDTEIVKAGEKLKVSKKKANLASSKNNSSRDWGKGFACAGRQSVCTLVPSNHFGPVPGVEVGSSWRYRLQASEAGIHRPHVAGIHGRENEGAYSIVLSGGYEDDEDRGIEFTYTGSGGRDLSGNKRTAEQSCDQTLTRMNRALALNCNTPVNQKGAEAKDWKGGKSVRVVRSYKGSKHSSFAPTEGIRYDGIYKVVKYWQASGKSGFKVWRYLLRRDDPNPAPWTKEGKKNIEEFGLELKFPEGYEEAMKKKSKTNDKENLKNFITSSSEDEEEKTKKRGKKRKSTADKMTSEVDSPKVKKAKLAAYTIDKELEKIIGKDTINKKVWAECLESTKEGKLAFLGKVEESFLCVCCQDITHNPVSTPCAHNVCLSCLLRSFKAKVYTCPSCRHELGQNYEMDINENLKKTLKTLFQGYEVGR